MMEKYNEGKKWLAFKKNNEANRNWKVKEKIMRA